MHRTCSRICRPSIRAVHRLIMLPVRPRKVRIARLHPTHTIMNTCLCVFEACSTGKVWC